MAGATWTLENVEEVAEKSATFFIPSRTERCALRVGQLARLHFVLESPPEGGPRAERMWVEIESVREDGSYRAYLTNEPTAISGLKPGDLIEFWPRHVARLYIPKDDPRWHPNLEKSALVSESVFEECCRWLYHESPDRPEDSGWRLFSGTETPDQLGDVSRIRLCKVSWLVDFDPSLGDVLRGQADAAFERGSREEPWREVSDWTPPGD